MFLIGIGIETSCVVWVWVWVSGWGREERRVGVDVHWRRRRWRRGESEE